MKTACPHIIPFIHIHRVWFLLDHHWGYSYMKGNRNGGLSKLKSWLLLLFFFWANVAFRVQVGFRQNILMAIGFRYISTIRHDDLCSWKTGFDTNINVSHFGDFNCISFGQKFGPDPISNSGIRFLTSAVVPVHTSSTGGWLLELCRTWSLCTSQ